MKRKRKPILISFFLHSRKKQKKKILSKLEKVRRGWVFVYIYMIWLHLVKHLNIFALYTTRILYIYVHYQKLYSQRWLPIVSNNVQKWEWSWTMPHSEWINYKLTLLHENYRTLFFIHWKYKNEWIYDSSCLPSADRRPYHLTKWAAWLYILNEVRCCK